MSDRIPTASMMADKLRPIVLQRATIKGTEFVPIHIATLTSILQLLDEAAKARGEA